VACWMEFAIPRVNGGTSLECACPGTRRCQWKDGGRRNLESPGVTNQRSKRSKSCVIFTGGWCIARVRFGLPGGTAGAVYAGLAD